MSEAGEDLEAIRLRAERALADGDEAHLEVLLSRIVRNADEGSEDALFAHRHLAEIAVEGDPWNAALHLKHVIRANPRDDAAHALLGLAYALLGEHRAACGAYRRALDAAPGTVWYHHNLGHLLDVALHRPSDALPHLERAYGGAAGHDEVVASYAHCLARVGRLDEARDIAAEAVALSPDCVDHADLLHWILNGAEGSPAERPEHPHLLVADDDVSELLLREMRAAGHPDRVLAKGLELWHEYRRIVPTGGLKAEGLAATVEYGVGLCLGYAWSQASVAKRYGVAATTVGARFRELRPILGR